MLSPSPGGRRETRETIGDEFQEGGDDLSPSPLSPATLEPLSVRLRGTAGGILQKQRSPHGKVAFGRKPERQPPSLVVSGSP